MNFFEEFLDTRKNQKAEATRDRLQEILDGVNTYATEENVARLEETALILHKYTTNPKLIKNLSLYFVVKKPLINLPIVIPK